jgi:hypothetical protein
LDGAFVFFRSGACIERAKILSLAGFGVYFARVKSVLPGFEFPDHGWES